MALCCASCAEAQLADTSIRIRSIPALVRSLCKAYTCCTPLSGELCNHAVHRCVAQLIQHTPTCVLSVDALLPFVLLTSVLPRRTTEDYLNSSVLHTSNHALSRSTHADLAAQSLYHVACLGNKHVQSSCTLPVSGCTVPVYPCTFCPYTWLSVK